MKVRACLDIVRRPELRPYVRRLTVTVPSGDEETVDAITPSGYARLGWVVCGRSRVSTGGKVPVTVAAPAFFVEGARCGEELRLERSGRFAQILVELTATGLFELLGIDGRTVAGVMLPLRALEHERLGPLLELGAAGGLENPDETSMRERGEVLQDALCTLARDPVAAPASVGRAASALERAHGAVRILDVAESIGVSSSQLRKQFRRIVGLSPKAFAEVLMFDRAMDLLVRNHPVRWRGRLTELAVNAGYYDQAHFTNTLKRLVGRNPSRYLRERLRRSSR